MDIVMRNPYRDSLSNHYKQDDALLEKQRAQGREWARRFRERKKAAEENENGQDEKHIGLQGVGIRQSLRNTKKRGFGEDITEEIANDAILSENPPSTQIRGSLINQNSTPVRHCTDNTPLSAITNAGFGMVDPVEPIFTINQCGSMAINTTGVSEICGADGATPLFCTNTKLMTTFEATTHSASVLGDSEMPGVDAEDDTWLHRNNTWERKEPVDSAELQRARWRENSQRHRKRKTVEPSQEDTCTPEELKRSQWRGWTQQSRKRKMGDQVSVAQLPKNIEFQHKYRTRNTTQRDEIHRQGGPTGKIKATLGTGDHNNVNSPVYDSGIWDPDASERPGFDEENLETHKPLDDDIDDPLADDEGRIFFRPDVRYKSYRVNGQDGGAEGRPDPYDYVYDNLPKKHHVLGHAPDCEHCGAKRVKQSLHLDLGLIKLIVRILEGNPYVGTFRSLGSKPNLDEYRIELNTKIDVDQRRYNAPTASQVSAIWLEGSDPKKMFERSVMCIQLTLLPLLLPSADPESNKKYVSAREYYAYKLQIRRGEFNVLFYGKRLLQQWIVDMYIKVESMRLNWYSLPAHQKIIRADLYQGVLDTLATGEARASLTGKRIVLPRSMTGCDRDVQRRYLDAMTLVQRYGKPDYFITMTCNPYWPKIIQELLSGQTPQDRPELVARVYKAKLRDCEDFLVKKQHFGEVAAYAHVTEFQKRGLPHEHFLLIMKEGSKIKCPDEYDRIVSAEIPDKKKYPVLHDLVCKHMMHGPCGVLNKDCPCMIDGKCRFRYPLQFCEATQQGKDSYPIYRRRDDGQKVEVRNGTLDNRWVVPYNPTLLMRYNCHINVEISCSVKSVKYLYKYIYKGHDRASFSVDKSENEDTVVDEIKQYRDARCITPSEAAYRLYRFPLYYVSPPVLQLAVHLEGMHMVSFKSTSDLNEVAKDPKNKRSMLTE
ncbi:hypothetical protein EJB05_31658, partial [Eragrostis curvula]